MEIKPSQRLSSIGSYAFADVDLEVAKLKKRGIKPIDFGVGDPKDATPGVVRKATKKAIDVRKSSGYPSYAGELGFRQTIANWCKKRFGISLDPEKEITSTIGSKEGIFNFHEGVLNPGDYTIMPNPGYPPYERGTLFAEGRVYRYNLVEENNFYPNFEEIPEEIVKKTKLLWLNYPNNPTTQVATKEFYKAAIDFAHDNNIILASDEAYTENYYDEKPLSILEIDTEGVIVFQSLSKRSNMTCYRVGWAMGDENVISIFKKVKTNVDSGTATFVQDAAIAALNDTKHVEAMRKLYRKKMDLLIKGLTAAGLEDCTPKATIYVWQKCPDGLNSAEFAKALLNEKIAIVTTPGQWISVENNGVNPGSKYVRFALVPKLEDCKKASEKLAKLRF